MLRKVISISINSHRYVAADAILTASYKSNYAPIQILCVQKRFHVAQKIQSSISKGFKLHGRVFTSFE